MSAGEDQMLAIEVRLSDVQMLANYMGCNYPPMELAIASRSHMLYRGTDMEAAFPPTCANNIINATKEALENPKPDLSAELAEALERLAVDSHHCAGVDWMGDDPSPWDNAVAVLDKWKEAQK
ncbi:hypothetical protein H5P28_11600 [Ruficoccus amylovorans]|uniref:Uncharacterized protein n=1 Tax=Ruficoccus amylovorans TaxID=1804625 RepID=A0A842HEP6_9BACT|nr:hypothetical protein [Ruficoccus amylovorans]MBC2594902.1 hypothetical protein [Ruficoccus amylovorans]